MKTALVLLLSALGLSFVLNVVMLCYIIRLSNALNVAHAQFRQTQYSHVLDTAQELLRGKKKDLNG